MSTQETLACFFRNLARLVDDARMTPDRLSRAIGHEPDYLANLVTCRAAPDFNDICALAEVLGVDPAEFLRRDPPPADTDTGTNPDSPGYWAERLAGQILAGAVEESRPQASDFPTMDAVLHWWHDHGGRLTDMETFSRHVEIFDPPDLETMRPVPRQMGPRSLGAREFHVASLDQLNEIFRTAAPDVTRLIAEGHADVIGGSPSISFRSLMAEMPGGRIIKLTYARLLLPVHDGDGKQFVLNYARPMRRDEIDGENTGRREPAPDRQAALISMS